MPCPEKIETPDDASQLLTNAHRIEQEARIMKFWADKQLNDATYTSLYTGRQLEAAEKQLRNVIGTIRNNGYQAYEPHVPGLIVTPYVGQVTNGKPYRLTIQGIVTHLFNCLAVHKLLVNGSKPATVMTYFNWGKK